MFNNYFLGLTGRDQSPLALIPGTLDAPTTDKYGKQYDDLTTVPATRAWIAFNTWIDLRTLMFGFPKEDAQRTHVPCQCTFVNNLVVRTRPQSSPPVNLGLVRDLKVHGNLAYSGEAPSHLNGPLGFAGRIPRLQARRMAWACGSLPFESRHRRGGRRLIRD